MSRDQYADFLLAASWSLLLQVVVLLVALRSAPSGAADMTPDIDCAIACRYFREAEAIAAHDGGELWGVTLYGPILYVHPETREVVANQADARGSLTPRGDVFVGRWTETRGIATTAAWWSGVRWAVLTWPPSGDAQERARLVMHESWHRVQEDLGLPLYNEASPHLETREGGIWLQLEWRALCRALRQAGESRRNATEDALWFRLHRQSLFPDAERTERGLELSEGLAEYTGIMLSGVAPGAVANYAAEQFDRAARWPTLVRYLRTCRALRTAFCWTRVEQNGAAA